MSTEIASAWKIDKMEGKSSFRFSDVEDLKEYLTVYLPHPRHIPNLTEKEGWQKGKWENIMILFFLLFDPRHEKKKPLI